MCLPMPPSWLVFFIFIFVVVLLLVVRGGAVCLPMPPSWPEASENPWVAFKNSSDRPPLSEVPVVQVLLFFKSNPLYSNMYP